MTRTDSTPIWQSGGNSVTTDRVRTRCLTIALDDIDVVEIRRPLLVGGAGFAIASTLLAIRFWDVLERGEFLTMIAIGGLAGLAGLIVARIELHSLSIDGIAITLPIWTAHAMRSAIDDAITTRPTRSHTARRVAQ